MEDKTPSIGFESVSYTGVRIAPTLRCEMLVPDTLDVDVALHHFVDLALLARGLPQSRARWRSRVSL